jgi:hypothetical protein
MAVTIVQENVIQVETKPIKMKYLFSTCLCLILINSIQAQSISKASELSNTEQFSSKEGALLKREIIKVGNLKKAEVQVLHMTDLISSESLSAIRLKYETSGSYSRTKIAVLDSDEITGLKKSIEIMENQVLTSVPINYTEVTFRSRGGFEAGCVWSRQKWMAYIQLKESDNDSLILLKASDFPLLLSLLDKAKLLIK